MTRPIKPATSDQLYAAKAALEFLCTARNLARTADSPNTLERIRLAISSARGAIRHIERRVRSEA